MLFVWREDSLANLYEFSDIYVSLFQKFFLTFYMKITFESRQNFPFCFYYELHNHSSSLSHFSKTIHFQPLLEKGSCTPPPLLLLAAAFAAS